MGCGKVLRPSLNHRINAENNIRPFLEHLPCTRSHAWRSSQEEEASLPMEKTSRDNPTREGSCNRGLLTKLSCCAGLFFNMCEIFDN